MLNSIIETLKTMGWLGVILAILVITNTVAGALSNVWSGSEAFSFKKMLRGLAKALVFYVSAVFVSIALTILPFVNEMVVSANGEVLISSDMINTLSSTGIYATIITVIIVHAQKALKNISKLATISSESEKITWDVVEEENEEEAAK